MVEIRSLVASGGQMGFGRVRRRAYKEAGESFWACGCVILIVAIVSRRYISVKTSNGTLYMCSFMSIIS